MIKRRPRGYSLLEIVIATLFISVVLIGIFNVFSSMVNFEMEALRKGTVSAWTVASINAMNKEIENANSLFYPGPPATATDGVLGCSNWSTALNPPNGGPLDANQQVTYFYYCLDKSVATNWAIRRVSATGFYPAVKCPSAPVAAVATSCTAGIGGGIHALPGAISSTANDLVTNLVNYNPPSVNLFKFDQSANGITVSYVVGNTAPTPVGTGPRIVNPQTMSVQASISMTRPYLNTND